MRTDTDYQLKKFYKLGKLKILSMRYTFLFLAFLFKVNLVSQSCNGVNLNLDKDYSYIENIENFELAFNEEWGVAIENQKAIVVFFQQKNNLANAGVIKNRNGYNINSAHEINDALVGELVAKMTGELINRKLTNTHLKNIPTKQVEYDFEVYNLGQKYPMSGVMFMIVNDGYTFVFMFNCQRSLKSCYLPFFKNVMRNAYFGQEWY